MTLLFLGVGTIAAAVRELLPEAVAAGTTRGAPDARFRKIQPISAHDAAAIRAAATGARVLISFPPDGQSDAALAPLVSAAESVVYLSSTAVYPSHAARIIENTPAHAESERAQRRLAAEDIWRGVGASIVRLPAFYGPDVGLHVSIARGTFRLPGDGSNIVSRVHVEDAARFAIAAFAAPRGALVLAGDETPAPVIEVVRFVCSELGLPLPPSSSGDAVPESLRNSRAIDSSAIRARYAIELAYPNYRVGYRTIAAQIRRN